MNINQRKTSSTQPAPKRGTSQANNTTLASIFGTLLSSQVSDTHHHTTSAMLRGNRSILSHPAPPNQIRAHHVVFTDVISSRPRGRPEEVNPSGIPSPNRAVHRSVTRSGTDAASRATPKR